MSKLDELIRELCPDGVEYKTLGEIGKFYGGLTGKSKKDFEDGNEVFITYKNVYSNPALDIYPNDKVKIADGEKQRTLEYGDIVFTGSSETPDECGFSSVVTRKPGRKLYLNSFCFFFRLDNPKVLLPDFSKHLFRSSELRIQIGKTASGVTRYNVSKDKMAKVEIPLPPLEVQREIVRILDNFTELTARKTQYSHYRDKMLTFGDDDKFKWENLGDVCDILTGYPFDSSQFQVSGVRLMRGMNIKRGNLFFSEEINRYWNSADGLEKYLLKENDIVIAMDGSLVGKSFGIVQAEYLPLLLVQRVARIRSKQVNNRYIYHYIACRFPSYVEKKKTGGAIPHVSQKDIAFFRVPIPSADVQNRIVNVLDNFEKICADLNIGLPAEIEARQKQYEYYRDKLLTFAETGNTILSRAEQSRAEQSRAEQSRAEQSRAEQSRAEQSTD